MSQLGLDNVQETLHKGDARVLELIRWSETGTMGTLISKLETAPPMLVLKLLNQKKAKSVSEGLRRVADDLDFIQVIASLVATSGILNSIKEALIEAFR